MKGISLVGFLLFELISSNQALDPSIRRTYSNAGSCAFIGQSLRRNWRSSTSLNALKLKSLISEDSPFAKRQKIREEIEELEDEDFLFADVKPKALVHERDFFRQATRIQAWDEYVLVSILCTSISFGALQNVSLNPDHEGIFFYEFVVKTLIQVVAGSAVLTGLYSCMVFSLSILYTKTALGLERDPQFDNFLESTGDIRVNAFYAFSLSLALFAILVVLVLSEDLPLAMHLPVGAITIFALYAGFRDWKTLVDSAEGIYLDD